MQVGQALQYHGTDPVSYMYGPPEYFGPPDPRDPTLWEEELACLDDDEPTPPEIEEMLPEDEEIDYAAAKEW